MKRSGMIILIGSLAVAVLSLLIWIGGLFVAQAFGGLIHLFLLIAMAAGVGVLAGAILLIVSMTQKR